jgi:hypothetical protein
MLPLVGVWKSVHGPRTSFSAPPSAWAASGWARSAF